MVATTEKRAPVKMAGYLEKRGKMRMVCRWKRLWFVLKGRLLHYYKSQMDYVNLSPCHGSLNMGIAASVRPGKGLELQVFTRSQTIILRAVNKQEHEQWLQALVDAMAQQDYIPTSPLKPVKHFRYSSNEVLCEGIDDRRERLKMNGSKLSSSMNKISQERYKEREEDEDEDGESSNMMEDTVSLLSKSTGSNFGTCQSEKCPYRYQSTSKPDRISSESFRTNQKQNIINRRLERLSLRNGNIVSSDTSIPNSLREQIIETSPGFEEKCQSLKELRLSVLEGNGNSRVSKTPGRKEITGSSFRMSQEFISPDCDKIISKPVNRSESLTSLKNKPAIDKKQLQDLKVLIEGKTVYGSSDSIYRKTPSEKSRLLKGNILYKRDVEQILAKRMMADNNLYENKEVKSDTDLSMRKKLHIHSGSCGQLSGNENKNLEVNSDIIKPVLNKELCKSDLHSLAVNHKELVECTSFSHDEISNSFNYTKTKSNSLLRKLIKDNEKGDLTVEKSLERKGTLKKRSLSFLKRMWKWKESKLEEQKREVMNCEANADVENPDVDSSNNSTMERLEVDDAHLQGTQPEPPPDYDIQPCEDNDPAPLLPPRRMSAAARSPSPWHDVPTNNRPIDPSVDDDKPPPLPKKTRRSTRISRSMSTDSSNQDNGQFYSGYPSCSDSIVQSPNEITKITVQLDSLDEASDYVFTPFSQPELINTKMEPNPRYSEYDVPRLHGTLRNSLRKNSQQDRLIPTHFLNSTASNSSQKLLSNGFDQDSLDANPALWRTGTREPESPFTPDSLECEMPWSLSMDTDTLDSTWNRFQPVEDSLSKPFLSTEERHFEDSLNTNPSSIVSHIDYKLTTS